MQLNGDGDYAGWSTLDEHAWMAQSLPWEQADVLELGCGDGARARHFATALPLRQITAAEVDEVAHQKNLSRPADKVRFAEFGAQAIDAADASFDLVLMFKSLHHVPLPQLDAALREIARVLRPDGVLYVSEPVFGGQLNEVLRLFHDEQHVRAQAFEALVRSVDAGTYALREEKFFTNPVRFADFDQFAGAIIGATHTQHRLSPQLLDQVRDRFDALAERDAQGRYCFAAPTRVDVLNPAP